MIPFINDRLYRFFQVTEVHNKPGVRIDFALDGHQQSVGVAVQSTAFVPYRHIR